MMSDGKDSLAGLLGDVERLGTESYVSRCCTYFGRRDVDGGIVGKIEYFVSCPVIRVGCDQMVVSNALDWDIVPKDVWGEVERDICRLVTSEHLDDPQGDVHDVMRRIKALAGVE